MPIRNGKEYIYVEKKGNGSAVGDQIVYCKVPFNDIKNVGHIQPTNAHDPFH